MKRRRFYFTLLEMILVISLASLVAGAIGINIWNAKRKYNFDSEVSIVVNQLRLAQDLMLILDADLHLKFTQEEGADITYRLESEKELPWEWEQEIKRKHKPLRAIRSIVFNTKEKVLDLPFLSGGSNMPQGLLIFSSDSNLDSSKALKSYILFSGHPKPIEDVRTPPTTDQIGRVSEHNYKLTKMMQDEIQARQ
jgi:hypothetical protein